ncbi:MAG TPA: 2-isopropylmalate synthase [Candidatus Hydrogenedentes bacterium]|nr:2-isopropylmalate synthase [Candidatus Hydrogenedentota bacterium]HOK90336.1 2-isopropylmalate synthase [Candidatus Hydrogenedentota bacterium]
MERVYIFDTTLRDGEQSPGASMDAPSKLQMALQLERLGVDVIEAGFPIASQQEYESVKRIAETVKQCRVAALARALNKDIERAASALEKAAAPVLHTFIASSPIHMEHKLRMSPEQVLEAADKAVRLAKSLVPRVEFSAEDATRSEWDFLVKLTRVAIEAGADVINLPDTVGYTTPDEIREMFRYVIAGMSDLLRDREIIFSTHNHNDLGLAVANALSAVAGGARQIECTVNGIGERAGNTSLEEVVMAMKTRNDVYPYFTKINTREIVPSSAMLSKVTGLTVPYNKPIVGRNAFAHESGIHQHGVIANAKTYEIMTPESVGRHRSELVLGKHSGRAGLAKRCAELGYVLSDAEVDKLYDRFIALADKKKEIYDDDLRLLVLGVQQGATEVYQLEQMSTSGHDPSMALVKLRRGEQVFCDSAVGDGPVHAACMAIERITGISGQLDQFEIRANTPGKEAMGEAHVVVRIDNHDYRGTGASTDIIEAAVLAYLNAINKYVILAEGRKNGNGESCNGATAVT